MISIHGWNPAQGSGKLAHLALLTLVVIALLVHAASGFEGSLVIMPNEPSSTLDGHVTLQDDDLPKTVLDFVGDGILVEKRSPQLLPPQQQTTAPKATNSQRVEIRQPVAQPTGKSNPTKNKAGKVSPFLKWVKPQTSNSSDAESASDKDKDSASTTEDSAPQVARRLRSSGPAIQARPLPRPKKSSSTAVASDLSKNQENEADKKKTPQLSLPKQATTKLDQDYPDPQAGKDQVEAAAQKLPPLTTSQKNLRKKIRTVLKHYYNRPLNTRDRSPWELMHAMLAFEADSKVLKGGPNGEPITAVGWLCYNQACKRRTLMYVDDEGELRVRVGPALQGHRGQLLSMLAQSRINENYPMLVEGHEMKVADLIDMEKRTCYPRTELTFKLIGLMHYLESDETWMNDQGMEWNIPRLISEELRQPVRGAACGGTHRLSGLTLAYKTREARGEPVDGEYLKAKKFVTRYQQYAYRLQNRDGSFSTEWFRGPGNEDSIDRKLKTTGHILEWLLYAAREKELKHWKTTKAANYLANIMYRNRYKDWEAGPLGHAIHALLVYDRLVFSPYDPPSQSPIALKSTAPRQTRTKR